jgi:hypothetical protein
MPVRDENRYTNKENPNKECPHLNDNKSAVEIEQCREEEGGDEEKRQKAAKNTTCIPQTRLSESKQTRKNHGNSTTSVLYI